MVLFSLYGLRIRLMLLEKRSTNLDAQMTG